MTDPDRRTWPGPMSRAGVGEGHTHDLPRALLRRVKFLWWAVVVFGVCLAVLTFLFVSLIQTRSSERMKQNERIQQEIRDSWCKALDAFPEGGELDVLRNQYDCGPGIPLDALPPEQAERLRQWRGEQVQPLTPGLFAPPDSSPSLSGGAAIVPPPTTAPAPARPTLGG